MFWSNGGSSMTIEMSSMDGSDVKTLIDTNTDWNCIRIDT